VRVSENDVRAERNWVLRVVAGARRITLDDETVAAVAGGRRTEEHGQAGSHQGGIFSGPTRERELQAVVERLLLEERQQQRAPAPTGQSVAAVVGIIDAISGACLHPRSLQVGGRKDLLNALVVVQGDPDLFKVVDALGAPSRFACRLDGRQQKGDEDADDRDDHEQLDEREPKLMFAAEMHGYPQNCWKSGRTVAVFAMLT